MWSSFTHGLKLGVAPLMQPDMGIQLVPPFTVSERAWWRSHRVGAYSRYILKYGLSLAAVLLAGSVGFAILEGSSLAHALSLSHAALALTVSLGGAAVLAFLSRADIRKHHVLRRRFYEELAAAPQPPPPGVSRVTTSPD